MTIRIFLNNILPFLYLSKFLFLLYTFYQISTAKVFMKCSQDWKNYIFIITKIFSMLYLMKVLTLLIHTKGIIKKWTYPHCPTAHDTFVLSWTFWEEFKFVRYKSVERKTDITILYISRVYNMYKVMIHKIYLSV